MISFKEQMQLDNENVFFNTVEFAEICTYIPHATGEEIENVPILFNSGASNSPQSYGTAEPSTCEILQKDIPTPQRFDKIVLNEVTHTVRRKLSSDNGSYKIELDTDQRQNPIKG